MRLDGKHIAGAAALLMALVGSASAGIEYNLVPLGTLGGNSFSSGINNQGQVVGWSNLSPTSPQFHAVLWSSGTMQDIGTNTSQSEAIAISNNGLIVGFTTGSEYAEAATFSGNIATRLTSSDYGSEAGAVNNSGIIAGYLNPDTIADRAVTFQNGTYTSLPRLSNGSSNGNVNGINSSGEMVGAANYNSSGGQTHPVVYANGTVTDLFAGSNSSSGQAMAVNDSGEIVGYLNTKAFIDVNGTIDMLNAYRAMSVNSDGVVVGTANNGDGMVYANGVVTDLNTLVDPTLGWTVQQATGINDSGDIVAWASKGNLTEAVELQPVPEPAAIGTCSIALVSFLGRRRRRPIF